MKKIRVDRQPAEEALSRDGVRGWSVWTKEISEFPWSYDEPETCCFLEGDVVVTPDGGEPVRKHCRFG